MKIIKNALKMRNSSTTEFEAINGFVGESGVHVGPEMPLGSGVDLWINPTNTDTYTVVEMDDLNKAINYSTEEVPTGGTWIDGKPIYRKVFTGVSTSESLQKINAPDIEVVINLYGFLARSDGSYIPLNVADPAAQSNVITANMMKISFYGPDKTINFSKGSVFTELSGANYAIICEYTKTTD